MQRTAPGLARWHREVNDDRVSTGRVLSVDKCIQLGLQTLLQLVEANAARFTIVRLKFRNGRLQGREPLVVHVNISGRDLQSPHLLARVRDALRRHDVPPHWLVLEMTETMLLDDPDKALERLRELKLAGIRVAIDDFGTGYSSLAYLRRYPVHMVKIDREFVAEIAASTQDQCIVKAMVDLAKGLDYVVLAEGVETGAELDVLRALGCQLVQGYLIGRPMPSEDALLLATSTNSDATVG